MKKIVIVSIALALMMLTGPVQYADAANPSVKVIFQGPMGNLVPGESYGVEITIYDKSVIIDPSVTITLENSVGDPVVFDDLVLGEGHYLASFIAPDAFYLILKVSGTVSGNSFEDSYYLGVMGEGLDVEVTGPVEAYSPGDDMKVFVETTMYGERINTETLTVNFDGNTGTKSVLGLGKFMYEYRVPASIKESTKIEVYAEATLGTDVAYDYQHVNVDVMNVYFEKVSVDNRTADFFLHVSNLAGQPIGGATVFLEYSYYDEVLEMSFTNELEGITDDSGRVAFTATYKAEWNIDFDGYVVKGNQNQTIDGNVFISDDYSTSGPNREMTYLGEGFETGAQSFAFQYVDQNGSGLTDKTVYWYLQYHRSENNFQPYRVFLEAGEALTDANGKIYLNAEIPSDANSLNFVFHIRLDSGSYLYDQDDDFYLDPQYVYIYNLNDGIASSEEIFIDPDTLFLGESFNVSAEISSLSGNSVVCGLFPGDIGFYDISEADYGEKDVEWWGWHRPTSVTWMDVDGTTCSASFAVPANLEEGGTFTLFVVVFDENGEQAEYKKILLTEGVPYSGDGKTDADSDDTLVCMTILLPGSFLVMGGLFMGFRRKKSSGRFAE